MTSDPDHLDLLAQAVRYNAARRAYRDATAQPPPHNAGCALAKERP